MYTPQTYHPETEAIRPKAVYSATPGPYPVLEKAHLQYSLGHDKPDESLETHGAPEGPRMSVVIKKKIEPQDAVLVAREACLHSISVTVDLRKSKC